MRRGRTGPSAAPAPVSHSQHKGAVLLPSLDDSEAPNNMGPTGVVAGVVSFGAKVIAAVVVSVVASVEASVVASVGVVATDVLEQHSGLQSLVKQNNNTLIQKHVRKFK
jgi:hypothetical protein